MPRCGVPYPERALCSLKNTIAMIEQKLGLKIEKINGVGPDPSGNVTIVSDDAALIVEEDATQHQVTIGLDRAELPSAAVTSVNGEVGAVVLDADDIAGRGAGNSVMDNIITLESGALILRSDLNDEITARGNADAALQANINAANLAISGKIDGSGNIGSDIRPIKIVNGAAVAVTDALTTAQDVQNALDAYAPMLRTTGNQSKAGILTLIGPGQSAMELTNYPIWQMRETAVGFDEQGITTSGMNFYRKGEYSGRFAETTESDGSVTIDFMIKSNVSSPAREGRLQIYEKLDHTFGMRFWNGTAWTNLVS